MKAFCTLFLFSSLISAHAYSATPQDGLYGFVGDDFGKTNNSFLVTDGNIADPEGCCYLAGSFSVVVRLPISQCDKPGFTEEISSSAIIQAGHLDTSTIQKVEEGLFTTSRNVDFSESDQSPTISFGAVAVQQGTIRFDTEVSGSYTLTTGFTYFTGVGLETDICVIEDVLLFERVGG